MAEKVVSLLVQAFTACIGYLEQLLDGVPGARQAIMWGIFVTLITSFLIIPLRGYGGAINGMEYSANAIHSTGKKWVSDYRTNRSRSTEGLQRTAWKNRNR